MVTEFVTVWEKCFYGKVLETMNKGLNCYSKYFNFRIWDSILIILDMVNKLRHWCFNFSINPQVLMIDCQLLDLIAGLITSRYKNSL